MVFHDSLYNSQPYPCPFNTIPKSLEYPEYLFMVFLLYPYSIILNIKLINPPFIRVANLNCRQD